MIFILTDDDLVSIFSYLDYEDLESLFFTCRRFSGVVEEYFYSSLSSQLSCCPVPSSRDEDSELSRFPTKNLIPFDSYWGHIELDKRWLQNICRIQYRSLVNSQIQLDSEFLYLANFGEVRRHRRIASRWYSDDFVSIGRENNPTIASFAYKKDSLICGSLEGTCSIFVDGLETVAINNQLISKNKEAIRFVDSDGKDYFITAAGQETKEWRLDTEMGLYELNLLRETKDMYLHVTCLKISPDGSTYFRSLPNLLTIVDKETGTVQPLKCDNEMALDVIWPPTSPNSLITAHRDGSLRLFDLRTFSEVRGLSDLCPWMWNVSIDMISPWTVVCGYRSNHVHVYDIRMPSRMVTSFGPFEDEKQATLKQIAADSHHLHVATDSKLISLDFNCV